MSKMIQMIDEMRERLTEITDTERTLVQALGDTLTRVDQKLLQDVRNIAVQHEARRGAILNELRLLAARIGAYPEINEPAIEYAAPVARPPNGLTDARSNGAERNDWRQDAGTIQDELDIYFRDRTISH